MSQHPRTALMCAAALLVAGTLAGLCLGGCGSDTAPVSSPTASKPVFETGKVISWSEASSRIGRKLTVEGPVVSTGAVAGEAGGAVLNVGLDEPDAGRFVVIVPGRLAGQLPRDPADLYVGQLIRATGRIESIDGVATITVRKPGDIRVVT